MTHLKKLLVIGIISIILISAWNTSGSSLNNSKSIISHDVEQFKLKQEEFQTIPSILRIGVMTPSYYLEFYEPYFDPIAIGWWYDYIHNSLFYEALVQYDYKTDELSPALATQWVVSKDGKHWTFYLREDVVFHDGSKLNATIVKWNYDRLIDPSHPAYVTPAPYISLHTIPFESVEIQGEYQITVHLKEPFAAFIHECSYIQIASPNSFNGTEIMFPYGTGPYSFLSSYYNTTYQNFTFTRFPSYYQGLAPFEQIHYIYQEDLENEIRTQAIDIVFLYNTIYEDLKTDDYWDLTIDQDKTNFEIGYINHRREKLKDPKVRLAINYAIDKHDYIRRINRTEITQPMTNLIPPGVPFHNESILGYPYNVTLANQLLDEAGYPRGEDNYRFFLTLAGPENRHPEIIKEYLEAIGIRIFIDPLDDWALLWREGLYDLLLFGDSVYCDPDLCRRYLQSGSPYNTGGFNDSAIDKLITLGSHTPVKQEREYYYNQLQPLIQETAPYLYLTYNNNIYATTANLVPYIFINKVNQLYFNYSSTSHPLFANLKNKNGQLNEQKPAFQITSLTNEHYQYRNVEITDYPIYFPQTDCIVTSLQQQQLLVNVTMSHNLGAILPSREDSGKFIRIVSDKENITFRLRCYYDLEEVQGKSHEQLSLFLYDEMERNWEKLEIMDSNSTFRYLEVELTGRTNLIRFNEPLILRTFRLVPFFVITIGGLVVSALSIVIYNFRKTKYIRGRILK